MGLLHLVCLGWACLVAAACLDHLPAPVDADDEAAAPEDDLCPEGDPTEIKGLSDCISGRWTPDELDCGDPPAGVATTRDGSRGLHWPLSLGCVRVTVQTALAAGIPAIEAALAQWEGVSCSALCFGDPTLSDEEQTPECHGHRLHFGRKPGVFDPNVIVGSSLMFGFDSGILRDASVYLQNEAPGTKNLVGAVGRALGLEAEPEWHSVMNHGTGAESPTADDKTALRALYGRSPYCPD